jgi:hypothetical protein
MPDRAPLRPEEDRYPQRLPDDEAADEQDQGSLLDYEQSSEEPDVLLDVPVLKVDEIDIEVDDLRAQLSLNAEVLDLLKLHVGADVTLGRVVLKIKGVEAQALLKVRLDNVAAIINRVLATIDHNPQILDHVTRGLESAVEQVGRAAGEAAGEVGRGVGGATAELGRRAGDAVEAIGDAGRDVAEGVGGRARSTVEDADATAEAPRRPRREARRGAGQAARREPTRARTDQAEESPPQRSRRDRPSGRARMSGGRGRPDGSS